jgi:hypothetical protein
MPAALASLDVAEVALRSCLTSVRAEDLRALAAMPKLRNLSLSSPLPGGDWQFPPSLTSLTLYTPEALSPAFARRLPSTLATLEFRPCQTGIFANDEGDKTPAADFMQALLEAAPGLMNILMPSCTDLPFWGRQAAQASLSVLLSSMMNVLNHLASSPRIIASHIRRPTTASPASCNSAASCSASCMVWGSP